MVPRAKPAATSSVVAIDTPSIEKIGVWPWPRPLHAELFGSCKSAGVERHRLRRRFQFAIGPGIGPRLCGGAAGRAAARWSCRRSSSRGRTGAASRRRPCQSPVAAVPEQSWPALVNVAVGPDGRVRRYAFGDSSTVRCCRRWPRCWPDRVQRPDSSFLIDFGIRPLRCPRSPTLMSSRRRRNPRAPEGQEGHHRRHRARTRRPFQRAQRQNRFRPGAAGTRHGIYPAAAARCRARPTWRHWPASPVSPRS